MIMVPEYRHGMYVGMSYEGASRKALELTDKAAKSGQTVRLARHLNELTKIMGYSVDDA